MIKDSFKIRCTAYVLILALCAGLFSGCAQKPSGKNEGKGDQVAAKAAESTVFALDTVIDIRIYGDEALLDRAAEIIDENERRLSVTDAGSEIYALNSGAKTTLSPETAELLSRALELCGMTNGAFDISIYPVVRAWGFTTDEYRVPDDAEISELLGSVDYTKILGAYEAAAEESPVVMILPEGMEIDLGGIAKGHIGQIVANMLKENGVSSALLNLGGNIQTVGAKPDGSPWRVAVQDPFGDGLLGVMEIVDLSVITSGGYERFFEKDGRTYWHIIDPGTGRPADSGLVSATVVGSDGALCDALSTACFVLGKDGAEALWRSSGGFEAVLVGGDGTIYITEGLEGIFETVENYEKKDVIVIRR